MNLFERISIVLIIVATGLVAAISTSIFLNNKIKQSNTQSQILYDINDPFSQEKVRIYLKELHVRYIDVAVAQMMLESASGTSKIFREGNNLFGMKYPVRRATTALGERNGHAYYSHWRKSCEDLALFQNFIANPENMDSESAYLDYIGRVYAEDGSYRKKLIKIKNSFRTKK